MQSGIRKEGPRTRVYPLACKRIAEIIGKYKFIYMIENFFNRKINNRRFSDSPSPLCHTLRPCILVPFTIIVLTQCPSFKIITIVGDRVPLKFVTGTLLRNELSCSYHYNYRCGRCH